VSAWLRLHHEETEESGGQMFSRKILVITQHEGSAEYQDLLPPVVETYSLENGLEVVKACDGDLLVLDCGTCTSLCLDVLQDIKLVRPDLPVIFVTEASSEEVAIRAFKSGARDYFRKPFDPQEFRKSVRTILHFKCSPLEKLLSNSTIQNEVAVENSRIMDGIPENIQRAICFIEKNLSNELDLEQIAREACTSKFHFCRQFKRHIGMSPVHFVITARIRRAIALLRRKDLPVSVIAIQVGFNDLSEFDKQFKKVTGLTPSTFRKSSAA
jgi:AraC-like DNA-binding protein